MPPAQNVTMRHVARAARVAVSTVSKALRNDPALPEKRCRSIQAIAARLGYRPHPLVATLMSQLHHRRRRVDPHSLAWIDLWPEGEERGAAMKAEPLLLGARERAEELGYGIEVYKAAGDGNSPERLRGLLAARGQWGLIIPPVPESARRFPFELRGLAGVTIGTSLHEPVMHRASPNHFQGCALALERLRAKGFARVGLVLTPAMNERVDGKWLGAFLACQQLPPRSERVSALLAAVDDPVALARWLSRERPDAVLVAEEFDWLAASRLEEQRAAPPRAWLLQQGNHRDLGHLDYRPAQLGRVAVEMVVAQIHRNERGSPENPQTVLVDAVWVEG
jgi:DNA-binding LacI/PurR family transcriptional regulator